ncbi:MAG: Gfo/Idh/MocA family oxidoreductase, partial [Terriglobia bacterium]
MSKIGVAVVGVGMLGKRHAENLRRAIPEAQLVAVADSDPKRAAQVAAELEVEHYAENPESVVARKDIQAVVIASPSMFHARLIQLSAAAGKHVFCEKPVALTPEDAQSTLKAVAKAGVQLQIGFMRRYDPAYA